MSATRFHATQSIALKPCALLFRCPETPGVENLGLLWTPASPSGSSVEWHASGHFLINPATLPGDRGEPRWDSGGDTCTMNLFIPPRAGENKELRAIYQTLSVLWLAFQPIWSLARASDKAPRYSL